MPRPYRKAPIEKRFWRFVEKIPFHECWEWMGTKVNEKYGCFWINGKNELAHRVSYRLLRGEIPLNLLVCHKCDNPGCVRPDHLFVGTHLDNTMDMIVKGRSRLFSGTTL